MAKVYYGNYGHNPKPNGKKYAYIGSNQYQVGQNVVAPVTHYISGKNYKTMFTIQDQADANSQQAENTIVELENMRKTLKSLDGTNVMELPGAAKYPSAEAWKQASEDIAQGRYRAAERLQKGQSESPVKATAEDLKERVAEQQRINYYKQHQKYLEAMRQYREREQEAKEKATQFFTRQDFQFFKRSDFDFFERNDFDMIDKQNAIRQERLKAQYQQQEDYIDIIKKKRLEAIARLNRR